MIKAKVQISRFNQLSSSTTSVGLISTLGRKIPGFPIGKYWSPHNNKVSWAPKRGTISGVRGTPRCPGPRTTSYKANYRVTIFSYQNRRPWS